MRGQPKENEVKVKLELVIELGEMDVGELATAIRREVRAMDIPNPDGGVMFLEHLSVVVKEVESSKNLPEVPTCTKSQTIIFDEKMRDITSVLIEGLNTYGSEHKQLALEQALEMLVPDEFAECKASWQWDSGR